MAEKFTYNVNQLIGAFALTPLIKTPEKFKNIGKRARKVLLGSDGLPSILYRLGLETQKAIRDQLDRTARNPGSGRLRQSINVSQSFIGEDVIQVGVVEKANLPKYWIYQELGIDAYDVERPMITKGGLMVVRRWRHPGFKGRFFVTQGVIFLAANGEEFIRREVSKLLNQIWSGD